MATFKDLEEKIKIDEIELVLECRKGIPRHGANSLKDLKWYQYRIKDNNSNRFEYDRVLFMPYRIDKEIYNEAKKTVINGGVSVKGVPRPHIDFKTGNIHPHKQNKCNFLEKEIEQLVLVRGIYNNSTNCCDKYCHPKIDDKRVNESYYEYKANCKYLNTGKRVEVMGRKTIYVPKTCYFPLIDDSDTIELKKSQRYILLNRIWEKINEND